MKRAVDISPVALESIPNDENRQYDLSEIFGNDHPVELELGIGKGRYLIKQAQENPDVNFVGVEWANKYWKLCCERAAKRGLRNIRFIRDDALHVIRDTIHDNSIERLHVYFPDPWPKPRHNKRRLIQRPFTQQAARVLKPKGELWLATDHVEYAAWMEDVMAESPEFENIFRAVGDDAPVGVTNWEEKFRAEGRTIHKFNYRLRNQ